MLKFWNSKDHRTTMDIDLLEHTSNQIANLQNILTKVASIQFEVYIFIAKNQCLF